MSDNIESIFKAYDVRGRVGTELTDDVAYDIGRAFADWLPYDGAVAVGHDMRPDSSRLAARVIDGLRKQGRDVVDVGQITTDMIYFAVGKFDRAGGIIVTASHNPGEYNGMKFCGREAVAIGEKSGLFDIRDRVMSQTFAEVEGQGQVQQQDIAEEWIQHVLSFIEVDKLTEMKLAVDAGNGMAGKIFPELEPYVPWQITEMFFELDGTFPNHEANPLKFETLADMQARIKQDGLDGGIAFDGDGDRALLVDEQGEVLTGGVMSAMLSEYFLQRFPGSNIVYDIRNSRSVPEVIVENGGQPALERVGHSFLKQKMREVDAPFGGEASGHFYFRDNWYADSGLIAAVIGIYVATLRGQKLSEIREHFTRYAAIQETNFPVDDKDAALKRIASAFPDVEPNYMDGITLDFQDGSWVNVRPSNTESLLRLNAEANTQAQLDALVEKVHGLIQG